MNNLWIQNKRISMKKFIVVFVLLLLLFGMVIPASTTPLIQHNIWVQTVQGMGTGDYHPDTYGVAFSPNYIADHTVFAGTYDGVYKSTDGGLTWTLKNKEGDLTIFHVNSVSVSPNYVNDHTLVAGTTEGVHQSTDGANNWALISSDTLEANVVAFSPTFPSDQTIFVGAWSGGVYVTNNDGGTWNLAAAPLDTPRIRAFAISPNFPTDHTLYVAANNNLTANGGVYKSTNSGASWTPAKSGLDNPDVECLAISPNFVADHTLFAGTINGGVYRTTDGGQNWYHLPSTENWYAEAIALSPEYGLDRMVVTLGNNLEGIQVSRNSGATWMAMNAGFSTNDPDVLTYAFAPREPGILSLFTGLGGGTDGGVWQFIFDNHREFIMMVIK